jgi:hypothetical protein
MGLRATFSPPTVGFFRESNDFPWIGINLSGGDGVL